MALLRSETWRDHLVLGISFQSGPASQIPLGSILDYTSGVSASHPPDADPLERRDNTARKFSHAMEKLTPARTLIVDDEPLIRWSLGKALRDRGCVVVEAGDAQTALGLAGRGELDLILLDLKLPDSEDLGLLERLRALVPEARVILMTAFGTPETKRQAIQHGATAVIDKPFLVKAVVALALAPHAGDAHTGPFQS